MIYHTDFSKLLVFCGLFTFKFYERSYTKITIINFNEAYEGFAEAYEGLLKLMKAC